MARKPAFVTASANRLCTVGIRFSANGAFHTSLGPTPQEQYTKHPQGLKARLIILAATCRALGSGTATNLWQN